MKVTSSELDELPLEEIKGFVAAVHNSQWYWSFPKMMFSQKLIQELSQVVLIPLQNKVTTNKLKAWVKLNVIN